MLTLKVTNLAVSYAADDKGYRVTGMESVPVGEGPRADEGGTALVQQVVAGVETQYAIRAKQGDESLDREGQGQDGNSGSTFVEIEPEFQDEQ